MRIYVDLDRTLVAPVYRDPEEGLVEDVLVRPLADWFLDELGLRGDVHVLSLGSRAHVEDALGRLGAAARPVLSITTAEDLDPVVERVWDELDRFPLSSPADEKTLLAKIRPIRPPGFMIDDHAPGTDVFLVKAAALGIGRDRWVRVSPFYPDRDPGGLEDALERLDERMGRSIPLGARAKGR